MDNGKPFDNRLMNKICDLFGFKQCKSLMYNAAANGLAEAFNKTLCNLLKKVVSKSKRDWNDLVLPLERQIPSLRLAIQERITDEENARLRLAELEALDEKSLKLELDLFFVLELELELELDCLNLKLVEEFAVFDPLALSCFLL
ncbi:uncharacterized protein [Nicotiana tomentosiformis]|uniref:uncharacterized protein n=1 Tax=Nicotiana tomentosiformis TaxID=4098 RepID=UPI00388C35D3